MYKICLLDNNCLLFAVVDTKVKKIKTGREAIIPIIVLPSEPEDNILKNIYITTKSSNRTACGNSFLPYFRIFFIEMQHNNTNINLYKTNEIPNFACTLSPTKKVNIIINSVTLFNVEEACISLIFRRTYI